jgi:hypothetical protein
MKLGLSSDVGNGEFSAAGGWGEKRRGERLDGEGEVQENMVRGRRKAGLRKGERGRSRGRRD